MQQVKSEWKIENPKERSEPEGGKSTHRYFTYAANNIPHASKKERGGEDSWVATD